MGQCFTIYKKHTLKKTDDSLPHFNLDGIQDWAKVVNVYDGDTFRAALYVENRIRKYTFRSLGYDSPEMKPLKTLPNRESHKERAIEARDYLRSLILDKIVFLRCSKNDKYGRVLVDFYLHKNDKKSINMMMIENNHGVPYDGGKKTLI